MPVPSQGAAVIGVGIDPHTKSHTAVAVDGIGGEEVGEQPSPPALQVTERARLSERIDPLEREIARVAQAPELVAIPGCGPLTAATLLAEVAGVGRFDDPAKPARHAGLAPVPVSSGARPPHRLDRSGSRQRAMRGTTSAMPAGGEPFVAAALT
jgi:hypothetical protein